MSGPVIPTVISVHPEPVGYTSSRPQQRTADQPSISRASSSGSGSETELYVPSDSLPASRKSRADRPRMADRQKSSSIIIPRGGDTYQTDKPEYPPDDARAMSPRRNSEDLERLGLGVRRNLEDQAHTLQSSLQALATRIDEVRQDHDRLENENRLLQEYIGGLTRSMSKENLGRSSSTRKGKK